MADTSLLPLPVEGISNPWHECVYHFCKHMYSKSNSRATVQIYYYQLSKFLRAFPDPDKVTSTDVETFVSQLTDEGKPPTPGYRNQRLGILASFYKFALTFVPTGQTAPLFSGVSPTAGLYYGSVARIHRSFSTEELARFFAAIPDTLLGKRDRAYFLTAFLTTRRREEILDLKWGQIKRELVTDASGAMRPGYTYEYHCKGNGPTLFRSELPAMAYHAIVRWLEASGRLATMTAGDYIFTSVALPQYPNPDLTRPIHGSTMLRRLKWYCERAGIDTKRLCVHSFRHTSIQQRLKSGQSPIDIMKVSQHKSLDAFYRYCAELQSEADPGGTVLEQRFSFLGE